LPGQSVGSTSTRRSRSLAGSCKRSGFARRAPFTINGATPLVVRSTIRVALLAALSRTQNEPDLYKRMENACSGGESIRFDAVKIKLLADAHPTFSYLQGLIDSWCKRRGLRRCR
jgi:hypothetical protein